jgi:hypothetical protein
MLLAQHDAGTEEKSDEQDFSKHSFAADFETSSDFEQEIEIAPARFYRLKTIVELTAQRLRAVMMILWFDH